MAEALLFWGFGGLAAGLAMLVIVMPNPIHCALALIGNIFCVAALFVLLDAHFLAAIQVLVYAGAIMVLFLFVIMLLNLKPDELGSPKQTATKIAGSILVCWVGFKLVVHFLDVRAGDGFIAVTENYGTIESIGRLLFGKYLLPFEVASILLLSSIIGAVAIAKKKLW
ncbi:MAG: NADH-quinone oxidoreductase subunit J [Deltaproteobacteria bacterium]|nr:NADH-quinone oxidoreductase subunit J [Deltaproteobacteria bacterium]